MDVSELSYGVGKDLLRKKLGDYSKRLRLELLCFAMK